MTEDEKLIHEFVFNSNLVGFEQTRQAIFKLDEKAYNMLAISGVLMTIIGGVLITDNTANMLNSIALLTILLPLLACVHYSSKTIKLTTHKIICVDNINRFLNYDDYLQVLGDMSISLDILQKNEINDLIEPKSSNLTSSMKYFRLTLGLILILSFIKIFLWVLYS